MPPLQAICLTALRYDAEEASGVSCARVGAVWLAGGGKGISGGGHESTCVGAIAREELWRGLSGELVVTAETVPQRVLGCNRGLCRGVRVGGQSGVKAGAGLRSQ
jgi:hypothetical protein